MGLHRPNVYRIISFLLALVLLNISLPYVIFAFPDASRIRVGLMFDNLKTIRDTAPVITISGTGGADIGVIDTRQPDHGGILKLHHFDQSFLTHFSLMQWSFVITETKSADEASVQLKKIRDNGEPGRIIIRNRSDGLEPPIPVMAFQLVAGPYVSEVEAIKALSKIKTVFKSLPPAKDQYQVIGQQWAIVGTYDNITACDDAQMKLEMFGWNPIRLRSLTADGVTSQFQLAIGGVSTVDQLVQLQTTYLTAQLGSDWMPLNWSDIPLLIEQKEWIPDSSEAGGTIISHWQVPTFAGWRAWIQGTNDRLSVAEHNKYSYRGRLEFLSSNDKMALVNDLPMDQYLASLLGVEMSGTWPIEALKAQAVTARTYAMKQGNKYGFAQVSDTTYDQVYRGIGSESERTIQAATETSGEFLIDGSGLIGAYFSSNAGGKTAAGNEVWGGSCAVCQSVDSFDEIAQANKPLWGRVITSNGTNGYIPLSAISPSGRISESGLPFYNVNTATASVRGAPYVDTNNPVLVTIRTGDIVALLDTTFEVNAYSWVTNTSTGVELQKTMNAKLTGSSQIKDVISKLEATKKGVSGRVTELTANGQIVKTSVADNFRGILGGLRSTLFTIDEMGRFTILSKNGNQIQAEASTTGSWFVVNANGKSLPIPASGIDRLVMNANQQNRIISMRPKFRFIGNGFGHGVGLSQWGAKQLANQGWTYDKIVLHYFQGATLRKEGVTSAR